MTKVSATKLRSTISDILNCVVYHGERVAVERYGKTVAALVSADDLELLEALENRIDLEGPESAGLILNGQRGFGAEITGLPDEIVAIRAEIAQLRHRMAHLERLLEGLPEAISGRAATS